MIFSRQHHGNIITISIANWNKQHGSHESGFGEPIHSDSRAQAIADGFLVDATEPAREAGFRVPVALTAAVWANCVAWVEENNRRQTYQDEQGRL